MGHASRESRSVVPLHLAVPARPESLPRVRHALEGMGISETMLRAAKLLTTELVTNSIRHADLRPDDLIDVSAVWRGDSLRVVVRDPGPGSRSARIVAGSIRPPPGAQSGWGLYLVDLLASRWGTNLGGAVGFWFELEELGPGDRGI